MKKKAGVTILISDKIDFKAKAITRDKENHYIILKGVVQQEGITLLNINVPHIETHKYTKKFLEDFKKEINNNAVIVGSLTPHCQQWIDLPNKKSTRILWH